LIIGSRSFCNGGKGKARKAKQQPHAGCGIWRVTRKIKKIEAKKDVDNKRDSGIVVVVVMEADMEMN
jgi:hypothetical protein